MVLSSVPQLESEPAVEQIGKAPEDMPFAIPKKWKWIKFSQVLTLENGDRGENYPAKSKLTRTNTGHPFVSAANLENSKISEKDLLFMTQEQCFRLRSGHIKKGDCLFCIRGSLGKFGFAISDGGAIASSLVILRPKNEIFQDYLIAWIKSDQFKKLISTYSNGSAQPNLGAKVLSSFPIPLPPIPEQHRITTKINQLFKKIDCAEQAYNELSGPLSERFRQLCLEKAVQGQLVPQLESEPAVAQIGEIPEDVPFAIPEKWKWISASYVQTLVRGITFPASAKTKMQTHNSICCLTTGSVQGKYASKADVFVDQSFMKNTRQILRVGDVVISSANSKELVGKSILWEDDSGIQKTFGGFLTVARVKDSQTMIPEFLFLVYKYMFKTGYFANLSTQTTNIANLSNKLLDSLVFPIPPLEEQHRIAAKLNELLGAVVQLENTISAT